MAQAEAEAKAALENDTGTVTEGNSNTTIGEPTTGSDQLLPRIDSVVELKIVNDLASAYNGEIDGSQTIPEPTTERRLTTVKEKEIVPEEGIRDWPQNQPQYINEMARMDGKAALENNTDAMTEERSNSRIEDMATRYDGWFRRIDLDDEMEIEHNVSFPASKKSDGIKNRPRITTESEETPINEIPIFQNEDIRNVGKNIIEHRSSLKEMGTGNARHTRHADNIVASPDPDLPVFSILCHLFFLIFVLCAINVFLFYLNGVLKSFMDKITR
jgi:hypothetical protein